MVTQQTTGRNGRRRRLSQQEIDELLAAYEASDLTRAEFARSRGIGLSTLSLWLRKRRERSAQSGNQHRRGRVCVPTSSPVGPPTLLEVQLTRSGISRGCSDVRRTRLGGCSDQASYRMELDESRALVVPPGFDPNEVKALFALLSQPQHPSSES